MAESRFQDAHEEVLNRQGVLAQRGTELDLARQQLADTVLVAPFDGAVRERLATAGEYVAAGQPIVTLVRIDPLRLRLRSRSARPAPCGRGRRCASRSRATRAPRRDAWPRVSPAIDASEAAR